MVVNILFLISLLILIVHITRSNLAYLKKVVHMLMRNVKKVIFKVINIFNMIKNQSFKGDQANRSTKMNRIFLLEWIAKILPVCSLEKNSNKFIYIGYLLIFIGSLSAFINLIGIYIIIAGIYSLMFGLLISFKETKNSDSTDYVLGAFWVFVSITISISLALSLFMNDITNFKFNFGRFFLAILLLLLIFIIVNILYKDSNITLIIVTITFSIIIPILFYLYLGYGLMKYNYDDMKDLNINIKENLSGFNAIFVMVYYGISEVVNAQSLPISIGGSSATVNKHKEAMSMNSIYLILLGHMFNVFFFSTIFSILPTFFKKKRYNVDK
ncbi:hypothetical protein [Staphylococcus agnetis]|uniref:hypothetical protein n=1 Tax=Staphylococcus agnetis TaxID=985762 RepID=UPI000D026B2E|nr:hypothetical protein [Staphylococcus agnetis]